MAPKIRPDGSGGGGRGPRRPTPSTRRANSSKSPGDIDTLQDFFEARDVKGLAQRTYQSYVARAIKIVKDGGRLDDPSFSADQRKKLKIASDYVASQLGFKGKYITPEVFEQIAGKTYKAFVEARKKVQAGESFDDLPESEKNRWRGGASDTISQKEGNKRTTEAIRESRAKLKKGKETNTKFGEGHDRIFNNKEEVEPEDPKTAAERIRAEKEKEAAKEKVRDPVNPNSRPGGEPIQTTGVQAGDEGPDLMYDPVDSILSIRGFDGGLAKELGVDKVTDTTRAGIHDALVRVKKSIQDMPDDYITKEGLNKPSLSARVEQALGLLKADVQLEGIDPARLKNWGQPFETQDATMPGDPEPEAGINDVMGGRRIDFDHPKLTGVDYDGSELSLRGLIEYFDDYHRNITAPAQRKGFLPVTSGHINTKAANRGDGSAEPMGKTADEAELIDANPDAYVEIMGLPTRPSGDRVTREQQTNKYMMTRKLPGKDGTSINVPVEGFLYDLGSEGFAFAQTSIGSPDKVIGYYRVPTEEYAKPTKIGPEQFQELLNTSKSDEFLENKIQQVSEPVDVQRHFEFEADKTAGQSSDLLEALGPDQKIRGKTPTLTNIGSVEATPQGKAINPNKSQDFARSMLQGLRTTQEKGNFITRPLASFAEGATNLAIGDNIRRAANEQVIDNRTGLQAKPLPTRLAENFSLNEDRLTTLAENLAQGQYEISANDLGLLSQATQAQPSLVKDLLERAIARGEKANLANLEGLYKNTNNVAELEQYFAAIEGNRIETQPVRDVMDLFFDRDGNVKTGDGLDGASLRAKELIEDGSKIAEGNIESLYALRLANQQPDAAFDTEIENLTESLGTQVNLNPQQFSQASPMLSSQLRRVRGVLKGDGLGFYGQLGSTSRQDVKLSMKTAEARDVWAELQGASDPEIKTMLEGRLLKLAQEIQELSLPNSPTVVAGDVNANMDGTKRQQGQRVVKKTIEDTDAGEVGQVDSSVDPDVASLSDTAVQGGFQDFASGIRASMSRLPEAQFKQIIGRAVAGDPQVLKSMGFRTADEFKNFFVNGYYRSDLGKQGDNNQATVFPSTKGNFMEFQTANDKVTSLQSQIDGLANALAIGRNNKGIPRAEYEGRRANSEREIEAKRKELEFAKQELDAFSDRTELEATRDRLLGYLDDVSQGTSRSGASQISSEDIVAEEVERELRGVRKTGKARRSLGQIFRGLLNDAVPETAVPWQGEATLENFLKNYDMGPVPETRMDKIANAIRGNYSSGDIASPEEASIQGARQSLGPKTIELMRQIQNGLESVSPEVQQAAITDLQNLQKWTGQQMLYGGVVQDPKTLASKQARRLSDAPPAYIAQNLIPGVDLSKMTPAMQEALVKNPAYNTWATGRSQTKEQVEAELKRLQPYATFNNQIYNMIEAANKLRVRSPRTAVPDGDVAPVEFLDPKKQKDLPIASGLGQLVAPDLGSGADNSGLIKDGTILDGPNKGMRFDQLKTVDRGVSGVNNFYVREGTPSQNAIEAILGNRAMTEVSLDDRWKASTSDQSIQLINDLQDMLNKGGSVEDPATSVTAATVAGEMDKFGNLLKGTEDVDDIIAQQATLQKIRDDIQSGAAANQFLTPEQIRRKSAEIQLIDNTIRELDKVRQGLDNTVKQGYYRRPLFEQKMIERPDGTFAILARTSPYGVGPKGQALEMDKTYNLQIPIGLSPDDLADGGINVRDTRSEGAPNYVEYSFNKDGTITPVPRDIEAENTVKAARGGRLSDEDLVLGSQDLQGQNRSSNQMEQQGSYRKGLEAARNNDSALQDAEGDMKNTDSASKIRTWKEYAKTRPQEFGRNVVDSVRKNPVKTAAGVGAGFFIGPAIHDAISPDQMDRERALALPPPIDPAELQRQRDQELLERIGGRKPLKSVTTQVPMSGRGRR